MGLLGMFMKEQFNVKIFAEENHVILLFPKKFDDVIMPWQQAYQVGDFLEKAADDVPSPPKIIDWGKVQMEKAQVRVNTDKKNKAVVLFLQHTDRLVLSPEAARIVGGYIKKCAQDCELLQVHKVKMHYSKKGRRGNVLPEWVNRFRSTWGSK